MQNLSRLDESSDEDAQGVNYTMGCIENLVEIRPSIAISLCEKTHILKFLLLRLKVCTYVRVIFIIRTLCTTSIRAIYCSYNDADSHFYLIYSLTIIKIFQLSYFTFHLHLLTLTHSSIEQLIIFIYHTYFFTQQFLYYPTTLSIIITRLKNSILISCTALKYCPCSFKLTSRIRSVCAIYRVRTYVHTYVCVRVCVYML